MSMLSGLRSCGGECELLDITMHAVACSQRALLAPGGQCRGCAAPAMLAAIGIMHNSSLAQLLANS